MTKKKATGNAQTATSRQAKKKRSRRSALREHAEATKDSRNNRGSSTKNSKQI